MGQIRVAKDVWDKLDGKAKEGRKIVFNNVFLNEPVLIDDEYVWDDYRITSEHTDVLEECKKYKPTKNEKLEDIRDKIQEKVRVKRELVQVTEEMVNQPLELRPNSPVSSPQDAESTNSEAIKEVDK